MPRFSVGIDTGGTYTDAVVINVDTHEVLATAKSLTTKEDLSKGIQSALNQVVSKLGSDFNLNAIDLCSISTTLATNALVEGHGSSVGVFLIGFDEAMVSRTGILDFVAASHVVTITGGHRYDGSEQSNLDETSIKKALASDLGKADGFAVASHYSVRNTSHEKKAAEIIHSVTQRPVTGSHELSDHLNGPRRALTATLNAKIISLIVKLERAVRDSISRLGLNAEIMIVKGDGSIATADTVVHKPIETILSGPAASVIGARFLTGASDFLIADIGGTTSDYASVQNGWPRINSQGAEVGGYQTLVQAIDMRTTGLGGDSAVLVDDHGNIQLATYRVIPISSVAKRWPWVTNKLKVALSMTHGKRTASCYLIVSSEPSALPGDLAPKDRQFLLELDAENPHPIGELVYSAADRSRIQRLSKLGLIQLSGFTPTDAAHVLGHQSQYCTESATIACELLGRANGLIEGKSESANISTVAQKVHDEVVRKSAVYVLEQLTSRRFDSKDPWLEAVATGSKRLGNVQVSMTPSIPLIAVGGPAQVYYGDVGRRLNCDTTIPEGASVANAIGAAIAKFRLRREIEVTLNEKGGYFIHVDESPLMRDEGEAAISLAKTVATQAVKNEALSMGGEASDIKLNVSRIDIPNADPAVSLVSATITAEMISKVVTHKSSQ
ncbi:MAG: hydantoinase/oxoprolinase family protein [Pseudomonadota bacterium]